MIELHITDTGIIKTVYSNRGEVTSNITYPSENNLPDDIRTKLAVLKLMRTHEDIPDIGQKVSNEMYWIYEGTVNDNLIAMLKTKVIKLQQLLTEGMV